MTQPCGALVLSFAGGVAEPWTGVRSCDLLPLVLNLTVSWENGRGVVEDTFIHCNYIKVTQGNFTPLYASPELARD